MRKKLLGSVSGIVFLGISSVAQATLIGDTVSGCFGALGCGPTTSANNFDQDEAVISASGIEFTGTWDTQSPVLDATVNFSESSVFVSLEAGADLGGFSGLSMNFYGLNWVNDPSGVITEVVVDPNGSLDIPFIINGGNSVLFHVDPSRMLNGEVRSTTLTFLTSHGVRVPAPTTTALLALGLLGAGFARRRTH